MAKTAKEYEDEYYTAGKARIDTLHQQRKQTDQQTIADTDAALTKAAQASADKYQQQIDTAPTEYQPLYDRNALSEALGRERAELKMANMGMTDSGLSETSQAALSVQRGRADAAVSKDMRQYVSGLETAISDVWAQKESALADKKMSVNKATDDWYTSVTAQLASDAQTAGAQAYAADREAAAAVKAARIKAQQEAEKENKFVPFTYSGADPENPSNNVFYRDGKTYSYELGVNPYTGTTNPDIKNGAFSNGYQPDNVAGKKLLKSGVLDEVNGVMQNVWYTKNSAREGDVTYYIWDGSINRYREYDYDAVPQ